MDTIKLTMAPLDVGKINDIVSDGSCGAISLFVGITRNNFDGKKVLSLEYECYEKMATKELEVICSEVRSKWQEIVNIAISHRLGLVPVGEASVVIAISSPHRQASLEAVAFTIEELKRRVPIWKKEQYESGPSEWKQNKECPWLNKDTISNNACDVQTNENYIADDLIQISAEDNEIQRRINCFIEKKREEINAFNVVDFMGTDKMSVAKSINQTEQSDYTSCARAHSFVVKQDNSTGHLRVKRVVNKHGPQTSSSYLRELDKLMTTSNDGIKTDTKQTKNLKHSQLNERVRVMEQHLGILAKVDKDENIYARIKKLENRIIHLESLSPEYAHLIRAGNAEGNDYGKLSKRAANCVHCQGKKRAKIIYTVQDLDRFVNEQEEH